MNREAIENLVVEATGRTDKTTLVRSAINIALNKISAVRLWSDLLEEDEVTISSGAASVQLASDVARISEVRVMDDEQSKPLLVRPKTWLVKRIADPSSISARRPCYGYLEGTTLFVIPYPDDDYDIRYSYYRLHPALAASTDENLIRAADAAVVAYAVHWVFKSIEKHEDAAQWLQTYGMELAEAIRVDKANSVVRHVSDGHTYNPDNVVWSEYWLSPFVERMP